MTLKVVLFGDLKVDQKFKLGRDGNVWVKMSSTRGPHIAPNRFNARSKDDPTVKIYVLASNVVIVQP